VLCASLAQPGAAGAADALRPLLGADLRAQLEALEAAPSTTLTAGEAAALLGADDGGCPALARLSLPGLRAMAPDPAAALSRALPALTDLALPRCAFDERCLSALAPALPRLRRLNLSGCRGLRDVQQLGTATALTSLDCSGAWHLPINAALAVALRLSSLAELRLRDVGVCAPGDGASYARMCRPGSAPALELLDVAGTSIGGALLAELAAAAPRLASLDVSRCARLGMGLPLALSIKANLQANLRSWPPPAEAPDAGAAPPRPPPAAHLTALMTAGLPARAPSDELPNWTYIDTLLTDDPETLEPAWGGALGWRAVAAGASYSLTAALQEEEEETERPQPLGVALAALLANAGAAGALRCLDVSGSQLRDDSVALIAGRCAGLASLSLADTPALTDAGVAALSALSALTSLDLTRAGVAAAQQSGARRPRGGAGVGDEAVAAAVAGSAASLRRLGLGGLPLTDAALARAVGACAGLTSLDCTGCIRLGDAALLQAASVSCPRLTELRLGGCSEASPAALPSRGAGGAAPILKAALPSGAVAAASGAGPPLGVVLRAALERLAGSGARCPLTSLTVECARGISDADVASLVAAAPGLRTLKLLGADSLGDGVAAALAAGAPALRKLALTRSALTASGLEALGGCPRLTSLNISRSRAGLSDVGVLGFLLRRRRPWPAGGGAPPALPTPEALLAAARRFAAALPPPASGQHWLLLSLSADAASAILEAWSALQPAPGEEAAAAAAAPPLTSFMGDGAAGGRLTAAAVVALGAFAPELESLSLRDCSGVSGGGVQAAALLMPLLREARWGGAAAAVHAPPWRLAVGGVPLEGDARLMRELSQLLGGPGPPLANMRFTTHGTIEASPLAASARRPPGDAAVINDLRFLRRM